MDMNILLRFPATRCSFGIVQHRKTISDSRNYLPTLIIMARSQSWESLVEFGHPCVEGHELVIEAKEGGCSLAVKANAPMIR